MSEILKYTFEKDTFAVIDGELVMGDPVEITAYFTMRMSGISLFEREYGKPFVKALTGIVSKMDSETFAEVQQYEETGVGISEGNVDKLIEVSDGLLDSKFVRALACASYVKLDGGIPLNTIATAQEFKETDMYDLCISDYEFIGALLSMAVECINTKTKKKDNNTKKRKN